MSRLLIILSALARPLSAVRLAPRKPVRWPAACSGLRMQTGRDVDSAKGTPLGELAEKLNIGERIGQGTKNSWVNPAYWNRQFVTASHIANNVPNGSVVLELGKDAKNLYYVNQPKAMTLIVPPSNLVVQEGPIREAAAKLNVPFSLFTEKPLDTIPLTAGSFDAAIIFDMLDGAPQQASGTLPTPDPPPPPLLGMSFRPAHGVRLPPSTPPPPAYMLDGAPQQASRKAHRKIEKRYRREGAHFPTLAPPPPLLGMRSQAHFPILAPPVPLLGMRSRPVFAP